MTYHSRPYNPFPGVENLTWHAEVVPYLDVPVRPLATEGIQLLRFATFTAARANPSILASPSLNQLLVPDPQGGPIQRINPDVVDVIHAAPAVDGTTGVEMLEAGHAVLALAQAVMAIRRHPNAVHQDVYNGQGLLTAVEARLLVTRQYSRRVSAVLQREEGMVVSSPALVRWFAVRTRHDPHYGLYGAGVEVTVRQQGRPNPLTQLKVFAGSAPGRLRRISFHMAEGTDFADGLPRSREHLGTVLNLGEAMLIAAGRAP